MKEPEVFPAFFVECDEDASLEDVKKAIEPLVEKNDLADGFREWMVVGTGTSRFVVPIKAYGYGMTSGIFKDKKKGDK